MSMGSDDQNRKKQIQVLITVADAVLVLGLVVTALVLTIRNNHKQDEVQELRPVYEQTGERRDVLGPAPSGDTDETDTRNVTPSGNYQVTMTTSWTFPDGESPSEDSYVENATTNTYDVIFEIVPEEDESRVLYKSPMLPIGSYTAGVALTEKLEAGEYKCVMIYHLYTTAGVEAGTVRVGLHITVEK